MSLGLGVAVGGIARQVSRDLHSHTYTMLDFVLDFFVVSVLSFGSIPFTLSPVDYRLPVDAGDELSRGRTIWNRSDW
ncbi:MULTISPECIES: hypothetical protein [unclassified Burkholderia]|uniref:hypothetical protein n=1 Tax=unclassified Burkholderia TaxID=2613784 RepID=UPI000F58E0B1|nr:MULTISPECIES: hypothetical protein [unclassified Burkholderia]